MQIRKKYSVLYALLASLLLFACNKNTSNPNVTNNNPVNAAPSYSFSGICSNQIINVITSASNYTLSGQNIAYFSSNNFDNFFLNPPSLNVGNVTLNGITFRNSMNYNFYSDSTGTAFYSPFTWIISGGAISSFTFTNNNLYPSITGFNAWPDTVSISAGFNVSLAGSVNTDEVEIIFFDADTTTIYNGIHNSVTNFSYSPVQLNSIATNTTATLQLNLFKNNIQTINGKQINFRNTTSYSKSFWIKN